MVLSVVIPVYNVAQYLEQCVDSVLASQETDYEILLVDDGSTDGVCPGICDRYALANPDRIRVIHQENQGLGGARNTGLAQALGEYVFFVDSDDYLAPEALSVVIRQIRQTHGDIYSFQCYCTDGCGGDTPLTMSACFAEPFTLAQHPEFLLSLPTTWARVWRRAFLLDSGVRFPSRVWYEDIRTSTKWFALARSIHTLPDHLYYYRNMRQGSIMNSGKLERNREIVEAFDDILDWFTQKGLAEQYHNELCRLAIDHMMLAASVRVAKIDPDSPILGELLGYMHSRFPDYRHNPYRRELPAPRKLVFWLVDHRQFRILGRLFRNR